MKNVLVTGATGFLGRKLIDRLLEQGIKITHIALNEDLCRMYEDRGVQGITCNLKDVTRLAPRLENDGFDTLYHLAWDGVSSSEKDNFAKQIPNIDYGLEVCKLAKAIGCEKVIFPGSASEYAYAGEPISGKQIPSPADAYSAAKASTHVMCELYARKNNLGLIWLLVPSVYGPGRYDSNIITYTIQSLFAHKRPSYTALEQKWEYLYIDDLIAAFYLAGEKGCVGKTYPIGSGEVKELREYVQIIRDSINPKAELGIGELPYKTSKIDNSVLDSHEFASDTGFFARVRFKQGIQDTIDGFKETLQ